VAWSETDIPDQTRRVAVITGANSGIGFETARALGQRGARVIIGCRNATKGEEAESRLRELAPEGQIDFEPLDLSSLRSIESFAKAVSAAEPRLDLLCNNAGVMMPPYGQTEDGFETQIGTNHLGHFALTARLSGLLKAAAGPRVVCVSSLAHFWGRIDFNDLHSQKRYNATLAYGQSKLANLLFTRELQRQLDQTDLPGLAAAAHPGSTRTELQRHSRLMHGIVAAFSQEPAEGALPSLYAATAPDVQGGEYFGPDDTFGMTGSPARARSSSRSKDMADASRLWSVSEELTGVTFAF
jgi:NAD(P)-dependent dehydrogenase (short-subunit alcohol dehydrogenase family)